MKPILLLAFLTATAASVLAAESSGTSPSPSTVSRTLKEADLTTITLTPQAEQRLAIKTVPLAKRKVSRTRLFPGELIVALPKAKPGKANEASANQSIFALLAQMGPAEQMRVAEAQIKADGEIEAAAIRVDAAQLRLSRAENLVRNKVGSARAVDEARSDMELAESGLKQSQRLRELQGPPLLPAANPERLWVRVPVYVGDAALISPTRPARVGDLSGKPETTDRLAQPVSAPSSTTPGAASIHRFYELENKDRSLQLGQKVGVRLPIGDETERAVIAWSAVVTDINGGTWVYERTAPQTFVRRRVQVLWVDGKDAVLASGPKAGSEIVTEGVAEMFGTEVGFGK